MSITAVCTSCGKKFQAPEQFAGKRVKCKGCGVVFRIPDAGGSQPGSTGTKPTERKQPGAQASKSGDQVGIDDSLAQLESVASFSGEDATPPAAARGPNDSSKRNRIGPKLEKKIEANPDADEIELEGPSDATYRANVMRFRYPAAKQIDQWLPLVLLLIGLILLGTVIGHEDVKNVTWIAIARFAIPVLLYYLLIFPITMAMIHKAGQEMRYQMPPNPKLRGFAAYMPAFAFTVAFWMAADGGLFGLILGAFLGLAMSSAVFWLLFRLREEELATSVGYAGGGFAIGLGIAVALVLGLNLLLGVVLKQTKSEAKVPASPFGPGLAWTTPTSVAGEKTAIKPHPAPPSNLAAGGTATAPPRPLIDSPVLSDLQGTQITMQGGLDALATTLVQPLSSGSVVALVKPDANENQTIVEPWDLAGGERVPGEVKVKGKAPPKFVISTDGERIAWTAVFPKRSILISSFGSTTAEHVIDLDPSHDGMPDLLGFSAPNRLLLRWGDDVHSPEIEVVDIESGARVCLFKTAKLEGVSPIIAINTASQRLVVASRISGRIPVLIQYDLNDGQPILYTKIGQLELSSTLNVEPRGLAYSNDGKRIGVYFEYNGSGLLVSFDADGSQKPVGILYTEGATTTPHDSKNPFDHNALASLDPSPCWLLFGDAVIDARSNDVVGNLNVSKVVSQRVLDNDRLQLITADASGQMQIKVGTIDRNKLQALLTPPPTTQQASTPQ